KGEYRLTEDDIVKGGGGQRTDIFYDAIAIGDYPIDLHFCRYGIGDVFKPIAPYQIPYRVTIPENIDGFMAADKNISVSHIVNGTTRLQPVTTSVGQAVGVAAAMASNKGIEPRNIDVRELQEKLFDAKSNLFFFKDLPPDHFAYPYVGRLAVKGYISGYADFTFKPDDSINESDFLKILKVFLTYKNHDEELLNKVDLKDGSQVLVTRANMVEHMYNLLNSAAKIDTSNQEYLQFTDIDKDSDLYDKLSRLVAIGVFSNSSNFRPNDYLTRAEAVTLSGRTFDILF
ncbi:MAG: FAD-dependent oxidoreductase, partial [Patescibacteria group bacterium]